MSKTVGCTLLIKDDFNNVLVLNKKVKRGEEQNWSLLSEKNRGKESDEKCIDRAVKDVLKSIPFETKFIGEYESDYETFKVYSAILRERIVLHKNYKECKWVGKNELDKLNLLERDKNILKEYFI